MTFFRTLVAAALVALATSASAQERMPSHDGYVTDEAGILSDAEELQLETRIGEIEASLPAKPQIAVVIPQSLGGLTVKQYGNRIGNEWGVGQSAGNVDNGVVIVLAPNERQIAIVPAGGLQGVMPDSVATRIIDEHVLPHLTRGSENWAAALSGAVEGVYEKVLLEPASHEALEETKTPPLVSFLLIGGFIATLGFSIIGIKSGAMAGGAWGLLLGVSFVPFSAMAIAVSVGICLLVGLFISSLVFVFKNGDWGAGVSGGYYSTLPGSSSSSSSGPFGSSGGFRGWGGGGGFNGGGGARGF